MGRSDIRHFLIQRRFGKLESIRVYDDPDEALRAYEQQERENGFERHSVLPKLSVWKGASAREADCVLLGSDRLSTCIATHGNWFDEPNGLTELLVGE